ncbi:hypothetical protein L204_101643 [Cryptococcus depauperatus]|nr:hypothetical protein L204_04393 [Cryptococcus depauperatus CBS 7855]
MLRASSPSITQSALNPSATTPRSSVTTSTRVDVDNNSTLTTTPTQGSLPTPLANPTTLRIDVDSLPSFPLHSTNRLRSNSALPFIPHPHLPTRQPRHLSIVTNGIDHSQQQQQGQGRSSATLSATSPIEGGERYGHSLGPRNLVRGEPPLPPPKSPNRPRANTVSDQPYPLDSSTLVTSSIAPTTTQMAMLNGNEPVAAANMEGGDEVVKLIKQVLEKSDDDGDTLDLSRKDIARIDLEAVEMFKNGVGKGNKGVWRLALSYNLLRDWSIVDSFAKLSRLRYLNLKGNSFSQFPPAIIQMPALEILDFSKNRITCFPEQPGHLIKLKVLSLTSNKIRVLPSYMMEFTVLKVLKVDQNPIEWPPKDVLGPLCETSSLEGKPGASTRKKRTKEEDLKTWIDGMKKWMSLHVSEGARRSEEVYTASEEELSSATSFDTPANGEHWPEEVETFSMIDPSSQKAAHLVTASREESPRTEFIPWQRNVPNTRSEDSLLHSSSPGFSPHVKHSRDRSASSFTSTPSSSTDASLHSRTPSTNASQLPPSIPGHNRGGSYTPAQRNSGQMSVTSKKSLPDLRQSHAKIIQERRGDVGDERPVDLSLNVQSRPLRSPPVSAGVSSAGWNQERMARIIGRKGSVDLLPRVGEIREFAEKSSAQETPLIDESRNSYFRRLSTLPTSTISKTIPPFLLKFVDAIRGILFALSQLHTALRQFLVFAVNERVTGVFGRVMEPAGTYLNKLINALDRFDSMSRRGTPPIQAIKDVFDTTKESVAVFGKVVAVVRLQIPALWGCDIRYTRTLLVNVYGAMAEVATSWRLMAKILPEIKMLFMDVPSRSVASGQKITSSGPFSGRTPISPIIERRESHSPQPVMGFLPLNIDSTLPQDGSPTAPAERRRAQAARLGRERRQAGSYSSQDVERGMMMGSPPFKVGAYVGPEFGTHRRDGSGTIHLPLPEEDEVQLELPAIANYTSPSSGSTPRTFLQGHQPSLSSGSSHALHPPRKLSVDVRPPTPASATLFDDDLLDVIETATDVAFTSWLKLAEEVGASSPPLSRSSHIKSPSMSSSSSQGHGQADSTKIPSSNPLPLQSSHARRPSTMSPKHHAELVHYLSVAEQHTATLRESLMRLRATPSLLPISSIPDDAQQFIKVVVKVSELVKAMSFSHPFPPIIRQTIGKLTQATRECAILMQVSSLRPAQGTPAIVPPSARSFNSGLLA